MRIKPIKATKGNELAVAGSFEAGGADFVAGDVDLTGGVF